MNSSNMFAYKFLNPMETRPKEPRKLEESAFRNNLTEQVAFSNIFYQYVSFENTQLKVDRPIVMINFV